MAHEIAIKKVESEEQHLVFAEIYVPDRPDSDKDFMTAPQIRDMAYKFMKMGRLSSIDVQHNNQLVPGANFVESFIARKGDPDFIEGSWVGGLYIPDEETWGMIKKGELNGFSMEALALRSPVDLEIDVPPVVSGLTMKSDGHEHAFHVSYDDEGNFRGGSTDFVHGHMHKIVKGTVTETAAGHSHRFSYIELDAQ